MGTVSLDRLKALLKKEIDALPEPKERKKLPGEPPQYVVFCRDGCESVELTSAQYLAQMRRPNSFWHCPRCGGGAWFNDRVFDAWCKWAEENAPGGSWRKAMSNAQLVLDVVYGVNNGTARQFAKHGRNDIAGRDLSRLDADLHAAVDVCDTLVENLYDVDLCKDLASCVAMLVMRLEDLGEIPKRKERVGDW